MSDETPFNRTDSDETRRRGAPWRVWRWPLHWQILLGLILGAALGMASGLVAVDAAAELGQPGAAATIITDSDAPITQGLTTGTKLVTAWAYPIYKLIGDLFLNGLKLIILPLVTASIILAVANLGGHRDFGRLGIKTIAWYLGTGMIAILTGLAIAVLFTPGTAEDGRGILQAADAAALEAGRERAASHAEAGRAAGLFGIVRDMVPANIVAAAASGQLLGVIVVSLLVGFFMTRLADDRRDLLMRFTQGVFDLAIAITGLVLRLAPIGIMFLIAATISEQFARLYPDALFWQFLWGLVTFALVTLAALAIHFLITMPVIMLMIARVNPLRHYRAMAPALMTAFSTSSSAATLPVTMDCLERRAGVSNRVTGFVLPLGATVNTDGTALYECVAAIFICQAFGIDLSFAQQLLIVLLALITSIGVAGVPSASLVAIAVILTSVQQQISLRPEYAGVDLLAGMALLFVFDRPLDMARTAVNVFGDSVGAMTIARTEGEHGILGAPPRAQAV